MNITGLRARDAAAHSRLGSVYEALDVTPDGDARTALLDELRDLLAEMASVGMALSQDERVLA